MCVIPERDIDAIFSAVQIPPPTAIRSVTHVMSIPILRRAARTFLSAGLLGENQSTENAFAAIAFRVFLPDPTRGEIAKRIGTTRLFPIVASVHFTASPRFSFSRVVCFVDGLRFADSEFAAKTPAEWPAYSHDQPQPDFHLRHQSTDRSATPAASSMYTPANPPAPMLSQRSSDTVQRPQTNSLPHPIGRPWPARSLPPKYFSQCFSARPTSLYQRGCGSHC